MTEERQAVKTLAEELVKAMKSVNKTSSQKAMGTSGTVLASKIVGLPAAFSSIISGIEESAAAGDAVAQQTLTALNHIAAGEFETITADTAMIDKVYATFGDFVNLIAENAVIGDLDVESIRASMGIIGLLTLTTADIQQAQIDHLSADNAFLRYGVGGKLYIDDLAVSNANIVNLAAGTILLNNSNGDLVELYVDATTGDITTRAVSYDGSDIINQNSLNGNRIVQNSITTTQLNASEIFAYQGTIMDLIADNIEASRLFANQGFIQQLQTTIISSDLSNNPSFISLADSITLTAQSLTNVTNGTTAVPYVETSSIKIKNDKIEIKSTGDVDIKADKFSIAFNTAGHLANTSRVEISDSSGIKVSDSYGNYFQATSTKIGLYDIQDNARLYMDNNGDAIFSGSLSANCIQGGTLTLGGQNNQNGVMQVLDANGNVITALNNSGAEIISGSITTYSTDQQTRTILSDGILKFQFYNSGMPPLGWRDALRLTVDSQSATIGTFAGISDLNIHGQGSVYISNRDSITDDAFGEVSMDNGEIQMSIYKSNSDTVVDIDENGIKFTIDNHVGDPFIFMVADGVSSDPLSVGCGGTGASNAAGARSNLGVPSTTGSGASGTWEIGISGNATSANYLATYASKGSDSLSCLQNAYSNIPKSVGTAIRLHHGSQSMAFGWFLSGYNYSNAYGGWFISEYSTPKWVGVSNGSWSTSYFLTSSNYTSYCPTKTGSGASGTWGINVTGSAGSVAAGNISGTVAIGKGGTGATSASSARNNLGVFSGTSIVNFSNGAGTIAFSTVGISSKPAAFVATASNQSCFMRYDFDGTPSSGPIKLYCIQANGTGYSGNIRFSWICIP